MKKNTKYIPRYLFTYIFGGRWKYGWQPNIIGKVNKYYREEWHKHMSFIEFMKPSIRNWININ